MNPEDKGLGIAAEDHISSMENIKNLFEEKPL